MEVEVLSPGVLHFKAKTQYEVSAAFMRMQEFYESPYGVRGKFFTLESYMDTYAEKHSTKSFTYLTDWSGFNVPGNIVDKFFKLFDGDLLDKEIDLWNQIVEETEKENGTHNGKYYVIGTYTADCIDHEHCHALWYLHPKFRRQSTKLVNKLSASLRKGVVQYLIDSGYHKSVFVDETNAYVSTSTMVELKETVLEKFESKILWDRVYDLQHNFAEFRDDVALEE